ncbi:hypothetical protein PENSPDRAFT_672502, partial [Peniophora sp. CONT]
MALTSSAQHHVYDANPIQPFSAGLLSDTVNFLSFSLDGVFLAAGSADGLLLISEVDSWTITRRRRVEGGDYPVSAVWTPHRVLFVGTQAGDVHQFVFGSSRSTDKQAHWTIGDGPIYALAYSPNEDNRGRLAVSSGYEVYTQEFGRFPSGEITRDSVSSMQLPSPGPFPDMERDDDGRLHKPRAIALGFVPQSTLLVGAFRHHGIVSTLTSSRIWNERGELVHRIEPRTVYIGKATLSDKGDMLYATNLNNGIDVYAINEKRCTRSRFVRTLDHDIGSNVPLPIINIHDGRDLLVGTTLGKVEVVPNDGDRSRASFSVAAPGHGRVVQALAYVVVEGSRRTHYIALGTSDAGASTAVHVYKGVDKTTAKTSSSYVFKSSRAHSGIPGGFVFRAIGHIILWYPS